MNNKILLLFPDGVGIRNYLYSEVFDSSKEDLVLFHSFDDKTAKEIVEITSIEQAYKIPKYNETVKEKFLRELICLARLKHNTKLVNNPTLLTNWKTNHIGFSKKVFYFFIHFFSFFINKYSQILSLEKRYQKVIRNTAYYKKVSSLLIEIQSQKVFCSHQRGLQCAIILAAAKDLGIQTTTVIYSWDNLPKARMALQADVYLVWSNYMFQELKLYYPEIKDSQIKVTGTPQFECYANPENIIPKDEFFQKYNLDVNKKIICYSGDDVLTCPDDPKYLEDVADELVKNNLEKDYQILLRRCPVDISGRFDPVVAKYPNLIKQAPPLWNFEPNSSWTTIYPLPEDIQLLVSTVYYSEVVVNLGSTMVFDFAMFQKPCIYINYDQEEKVNPNWSVKWIYNLQHFKSMPSQDVVLWWNNKSNFTKLINQNINEETLKWKNVIFLNDNASKMIKKIMGI